MQRDVLEDMSLYVLPIDSVLGYTVLVHAHQCQNLESTLIDLGASIGNDANNDFFPSVRSPCVGAGTRTKMGNVLDHGIHRLAKENLVFIVPGFVGPNMNIRK